MPGNEFCFTDAVHGLEPQCPRAHRHDDVIILVPVPSGRFPGGEPPLGDARAPVVDLNRGLGGAPAGRDIDLLKPRLRCLYRAIRREDRPRKAVSRMSGAESEADTVRLSRDH